MIIDFSESVNLKKNKNLHVVNKPTSDQIIEKND